MIASFLSGTLTVLNVIACLLLIGVVLIQKDRGGGLAGAFGGGSLGTPFGIRTATILTKITAGLFGAIVLFSLILLWVKK